VQWAVEELEWALGEERGRREELERVIGEERSRREKLERELGDARRRLDVEQERRQQHERDLEHARTRLGELEVALAEDRGRRRHPGQRAVRRSAPSARYANIRSCDGTT